MFGGRDLSGLQFGVLGGAPIDLNGADFAGADLSGTDADDILVHHCNFNGARFDESRSATADLCICRHAPSVSQTSQMGDLGSS